VTIWRAVRDEATGAWRSLKYDLGRRRRGGAHTEPGHPEYDAFAGGPRRIIISSGFAALVLGGALGGYFGVVHGLGALLRPPPSAPVFQLPTTATEPTRAAPRTTGKPTRPPARPVPAAPAPGGRPVPVRQAASRPLPPPVPTPAPNCACVTPPAPSATTPGASPTATPTPDPSASPSPGPTGDPDERPRGSVTGDSGR